MNQMEQISIPRSVAFHTRIQMNRRKWCTIPSSRKIFVEQRGSGTYEAREGRKTEVELGCKFVSIVFKVGL